ncbi:hypothetical protein JQ629_24360 [Bradyrhizobium sp. AUGA SZCCT0222]|uniref:hypothetical protein n=1 Tax=Bradyrhizobium sp. AUGA SZCCT0222 TaxID=2807668 RepID=UPI001BA7880D|nr:hypothetical protein [Bradyrhizobium sp. AUGA SZCCT0222]MBR1270612.1 hypothetical protein [Bradyrhizobium sp. AUGA SZCCT0222]
MKLAGGSRLTWRPLVASLRLFRSAYSRFATIAWTPHLFAFGQHQSPQNAVSEAVGYKLTPTKGGRITANISSFLGEDFLVRARFVHNNRILPNPYYFAVSPSLMSPLRPLSGPVHGDCHSQNLFINVGQDPYEVDVQLVDLATYQSKSLFFFDHAYLELATMLRQMDQLGDRRWLEFVLALSRNASSPMLEPDERGWVEDILEARRDMFALVARNYPDRMDDLKLQFLLAQVAAGLAFLHKIPREGNSSGGLSASQYQQSFVWAASFLNQFLDSLSVSIESLFPSETEVPILGKVLPPGGTTPASEEWRKVKYFDSDGFNVLVIPNSPQSVPKEISSLPWSLIIDFRERPPSENEIQLSGRLFRQSWPGQQLPDFRLFARGGLWHFANGRSDISGVEPSPTPSEWRRRYRRSLDDILTGISESASPVEVRALILANAFPFDQIRLVAESLDTAFGDTLAPIVVVSDDPQGGQLDGIRSIRSTVDAAVIVLDGARAAAPTRDIDVALLPRREGTAFSLAEIPPNLLARVSRDLTLLFRARAQTFPPGRVFGRDFRRGMPIEWAELAQNLDVGRKAAFARYYDEIEEGLRASSNRTVNLLHEPSAGGTTLGRRLAWEFMERYPVVLLDQISSDTASYLRDIFQFSSLPVLVLMESVVVTESEREGLLRQLREDNTRAVFLWVSRAYGYRESKEILSGKLEDTEVTLFRDAYLEQVNDDARRKAIQRLSSSSELQEQRNPFFFGLTAFGENFLGADRLVQDVIDQAMDPIAKSLLIDLCLVSVYSNDGFPIYDYDELCVRFNESKWPVARESLFLLTTASHVKVSHALLAEKVLAALSRADGQWRVDLSLFSSTLLTHLASLTHRVSDRIETIVQTLFITRDIESAIEADNDIQTGGIATQRRFSPLINDLGNVAQARTIFRRVVQLWPKGSHYAAHLARHLLYEEPKEVEEAVTIATAVERTSRDDGDAALVHVVGMAYRVRMEQRLREASNEGRALQSIEGDTRSDFQAAVDAFTRATAMKPGNEYGLVATIQTVSTLLRFASELAKATYLGQFLRQSSRGWYLDALALAEESIDELKRRPQTSIRARRAIAEWDLVYGKIDKVISDLRILASRYEDMAVRRALCSAIIARAKHNWNSISQGDLQTIALMMERNIHQQGVRDADVRRWLSAYRRLRGFDVNIAIERLLDWHNLNPRSVDPVFYLYVFYFLRWLPAPSPREGLALQVNDWIKKSQVNRPFGERAWSYEWLKQEGARFRIANFSDLDFDPPSLIRAPDNPDRKRLDAQLGRVEGTMRNYRGPQNATLDLGQSLMVRITPLDKLSKDDEGKRISAFLSFSYDGLVGWDPMLAPR